jgi:Asp-tRNA(Asn)/Glu-tRNA(Gln) amidotransferase A subunit family amidase
MDPADTVNPWNWQHTPGGSSSGSAAAVASCMCPAALGSQTAGSVLRPAAYCGIAGLKPTYDAISRQGMFPCAWSMDHVGIMARSVADVAAVFAAIAESPMPEIPEAQGKLTLGVPDRYFQQDLTVDAASAFEAALDSFRDLGAAIRAVKLPASFEAGVEAGIVIMYAEMAAVHRSSFAAQKAAFPFRIRTLIEVGLEIRAADYLRAQQVRRQFVDDLSGLLAEVDCLVTPTTPAPAPKGLDATGDWRFNLPFSASGHPALTVPCGFSRDGLPIGLQLVASHWGERRLLGAGQRFQASTDWHERRPSMLREDAA